jgi:hypothetical protein
MSVSCEYVVFVTVLDPKTALERTFCLYARERRLALSLSSSLAGGHFVIVDDAGSSYSAPVRHVDFAKL